jgi:Phage integrase family
MSDVSRMAWSDVDEGGIRVVQGKTGAKLTVPLHPELAEVLTAWPRSHQRILTTAFGKPFTPKGFGNWMAGKIGQSGVASRCITHGLRKAAARRLAEAGFSANEIAAITGHATLAEISRYTKAAEQRTLARSAISRLAHKPSVHRVPNPSSQFGKNSEKPNEINVDLFNWRPVGRRWPPYYLRNLLKIQRFMRVKFLVCCTVCSTWRACLRGIAIRTRSSRTIKIIQWSGRRSPFDEHDSLPVRGRQVLDVRVAEKADSTARSTGAGASTGGTAGAHQ